MTDEDTTEDVGFPATGYPPDGGGSSLLLIVTGLAAAGAAALSLAAWRFSAATRRHD